MSKISIDDPGPVLAAIAEFDQLGRDAFLRTYGFHPASEYFLLHEGRLYDSKAIVGAAHKYAHGRALGHEEFSGGTAGAVRVLKQLGFTIHREARTPPWTDEERIIALDVYFTSKSRPPFRPSDDEVRQLSSFLRQRPVFPESVRADERFRSVADVRNKLNVFAGLDPQMASPIRRAPYPDVQVWRRWHQEVERLHTLAEDLRRQGAPTTSHASPGGNDPGEVSLIDAESALFTSPEEEQEAPLTEGRIVRVSMNRYERSAKARARCIAHYGSACQVCGLDFAGRYGDIGQGFIHVHHLIELSAIREGYEVDPIQDLRPVCPNCHAMLHTQSPPLTIEELRESLSH